jgi:hypothetical protein
MMLDFLEIFGDFSDFEDFGGKLFDFVMKQPRCFGISQFHHRCKGHANTLIRTMTMIIIMIMTTIMARTMILGRDGNIVNGFTSMKLESDDCWKVNDNMKMNNK